MEVPVDKNLTVKPMLHDQLTRAIETNGGQVVNERNLLLILARIWCSM